MAETGAGGAAVEVSGLVKRYPKAPVNAVDGVTFTVQRGEVFGLLGPNGAGKTTTIGVLTTRVKLTAGTARVGGIDVARDPVGARRMLAVVPQRMNLDRSLSIRQNLIFHAAYHRVPAAERNRRADELLELFGLSDRANDKPDFMSGGQSQRIMIARSMMHTPLVLFLDEPSTGLDPAARLFVWDRIRDLRDRGTTIVITTHDMDEAATLTERVGIMDHGKLLALDRPETLTLAPGKDDARDRHGRRRREPGRRRRGAPGAGGRRAAGAARAQRRAHAPLRRGRRAAHGGAGRERAGRVRDLALRRQDRRAQPGGRVHHPHGRALR